MQDYNSAYAFIAALTQADPNTAVIDVRMIHDVDKATAAIPRRGTLPQLWNEIVAWNNAGYGAFININEMDGNGREIANVKTIRCQAIDLDNLSARQNYERATQFYPLPAFAVHSSPNKYHVYWTTKFHTNFNGFTLLQRKLRTLFDGDKRIVDPSRVLRLPGTLHLKNPQQPHLVTCWALAAYGQPIDPSVLEIALFNVNVIDGTGGRHDLGDVTLQAPGLEWCIRALQECDPNSLERGEWISFTSAFKQASWNFAPEHQLFELWSKWCERYTANDPAENKKNWDSIRNTEVGWPSIERRNPNLHAMRLFGEKKQSVQPQPLSSDVSTTILPPSPNTMPLPAGEFYNDNEQKILFAGCVFIERMGEILTPSGRFMNSTKFNGSYGGRKFIIDSAGKVTTEAWQAATRSTLFTIPKADHIRFKPDLAQGSIITDALGRKGVNTYRPAIIDSRPGDITPFWRNMELILPNQSDREILFAYLAHVAKFPGYKIPWAPLIQSVQGVGKGLIKLIMTNAVGGPYAYFPKAKELIESGNTFNAWMRSRLFILVDEIRVDERLDMVEILKPMISEKEIEVQAKGIDQDMEDNPANWLFFSNWKDAIPINQNDRRFCINYSAIQSVYDLKVRGMNDAYFADLYDWAENRGGAAFVTHWLLNYPINRGAIPMRAPTTTSTREAVTHSRGPVEKLLLDAIEDAMPGFRGGWVSSLAVANRLKATTIRAVSAKTLGTILEVLGYHLVGRAPRPYFLENKDMRADLYNCDRTARVEQFGSAQGYEG